jgi:hypothetical protein
MKFSVVISWENEILRSPKEGDANDTSYEIVIIRTV